MTDDRKPDPCVRHDCRRALAESRAEVERLRAMLGDCYVEAGGDTDGNDPSRLADQALSAVQDLRRDYDNALSLEPNP